MSIASTLHQSSFFVTLNLYFWYFCHFFCIFKSKSAAFRFTLVDLSALTCVKTNSDSCARHSSFDVNNRSRCPHLHKFSIVFFTYSKVLACFSIHPREAEICCLGVRHCADVVAARGSSWLSVLLPSARAGAVCGSASLWNINMTRNIISHDSRRRGNTKYYPAEAPVGWPAGRSTTPAARWLYFAPGSSPQDMQRSRNAVINWLSRVTTPRCGRKKRACERASERASHEPDPAASAAILDRAILTSALRETVRRWQRRWRCFLRLSFARSVIYRPYFPSQARGTVHRTNPSSLFTVRFFARFRIISAITVASVLPKLDTLLARRHGEPYFKQSYFVMQLHISLLRERNLKHNYVRWDRIKNSCFDLRF